MQHSCRAAPSCQRGRAVAPLPVQTLPSPSAYQGWPCKPLESAPLTHWAEVWAPPALLADHVCCDTSLRAPVCPAGWCLRTHSLAKRAGWCLSKQVLWLGHTSLIDRCSCAAGQGPRQVDRVLLVRVEVLPSSSAVNEEQCLLGSKAAFRPACRQRAACLLAACGGTLAPNRVCQELPRRISTAKLAGRWLPVGMLRFTQQRPSTLALPPLESPSHLAGLRCPRQPAGPSCLPAGVLLGSPNWESSQLRLHEKQM